LATQRLSAGALAARDQRVHGIRPSRDHGLHIAPSARFTNVGDADGVATLACDTGSPAVIMQFIDAWKDGTDGLGRPTCRDESLKIRRLRTQFLMMGITTEHRYRVLR
jgi:hypothetical protein